MDEINAAEEMRKRHRGAVYLLGLFVEIRRRLLQCLMHRPPARTACWDLAGLVQELCCVTIMLGCGVCFGFWVLGRAEQVSRKPEAVFG